MTSVQLCLIVSLRTQHTQQDSKVKMDINVVSTLLGLLAAWFWYDKRQVDNRLTELEKKSTLNEKDLAVMAESISSMNNLLEVKLGNIEKSVQRIEDDVNGGNQ